MSQLATRHIPVPCPACGKTLDAASYALHHSRALWLWVMGGIENAPLGFLHTFYYQTLEVQQ